MLLRSASPPTTLDPPSLKAIVLDDEDQKQEEPQNTGTSKKPEPKKTVKRRKRVSLKCGCKFKVYARVLDEEVCEIRSSALTHTNGCSPSPAYAAAGDRARGITLDAATVASLKEDVVTMKLTYTQVMAKLHKKGIHLQARQARNIRYRLMKGLPVGPKHAIDKADSPVESSFSATKKAIGDSPQSFAGVVQATVRRDEEQTSQEQANFIKQSILDFKPPSYGSDAANACCRVCSDFATQYFQEQARTGCMDYNSIHQPQDNTYHVARKNSAAEPRIVSLDPTLGRYVCSCLEDRNMQMPCRHILCVTKGAFDPQYFGNHWLRLSEVVLVPPDSLVDEEEAPSAEPVSDMRNASSSHDLSASVQPIPEEPEVNTGQQPAASRGRKRKKTSADYFNSLLDHCKELCKRVSAQGAESYEKVLPLIDWLTANFNSSGSQDDMRLSMASYLSLDLEDEKSASVLSAPPIKRPAGLPTTKRKKSAVEASQSSRSVKSCGLCKNKAIRNPGAHQQRKLDDLSRTLRGATTGSFQTCKRQALLS